MVSTAIQPDDNTSLILSEALQTSNTHVSPIHIHTIEDVNLDRASYDADFFNGDMDADIVAQAMTVQDVHTVPSLNSLSLEDMNCFIDTLTQKTTPTLKQFTTADLKQHINNYWRLKIRIQMDSGASDCITPDRNLLKHFTYVKLQDINTADVTSDGCRIEGEGYMDIQTSTGD